MFYSDIFTWYFVLSNMGLMTLVLEIIPVYGRKKIDRSLNAPITGANNTDESEGFYIDALQC